MSIFYVDGEYVEEARAALPLTDMAILRGYAVFDFLRTYNGKPFHLEEHLTRLQNSAALLHIQCPWSLEYFKDIVKKLLVKNNFREANLRFLITGGDSIDSITPLDKPRLIIMATELKSFPEEWYTDGVRIITSNITRYVPGSKSTNYIKAIMALKNARNIGAIESIYVNEAGHLLEGTTSNFFIVVNGEIITPKEGVLPGITMEVVIKLAKGIFPLKKDVISRDMLNECSEAFITSSNKEVVPVVQVDDLIISNKPGPVTSKVIDLFGQYTQSW